MSLLPCLVMLSQGSMCVVIKGKMKWLNSVLCVMCISGHREQEA